MEPGVTSIMLYKLAVAGYETSTTEPGNSGKHVACIVETKGYA